MDVLIRTASGRRWRHRSNVASNFNGKVIVGDYQNGKIYEFDKTNYTDDGDYIQCLRRCQHLLNDLKYTYFSQLQIQFQEGVGLQSGQGSDPQAMLRLSDDGGQTYGNVHYASIGKVGQYRNRSQWQRLGAARDRVFEVTLTDPVFRVVVSADLQSTAGLT